MKEIVDQVCLISGLPDVVNPVLMAGAAVGVRIEHTQTPDEIRQALESAQIVLIGTDFARHVADLGWQAKGKTYLLGVDPELVITWSVPLAASALVLPKQVGLLGPILSQIEQITPKAKVISCISASGGLGVTTLACGLGQIGADQGISSCVVELAESGGGIDLLFSAEQEPGWRWEDVSSASGFVNSLRGKLPNVSGVDLMSLGRKSTLLPGAGAVRAIIESLTRSHDLVILDSPSSNYFADHTLFLVGADSFGISAAARQLSNKQYPRLELISRTGPGRRVGAAEISEALKRPVIGTIPNDAKIPIAAQDGRPPGRGMRGKFLTSVQRIFRHIWGG